MFVHEASRVIVERNGRQFSAAVKTVVGDEILVIEDGSGVEVWVERGEIVAVMAA